MRSQTTHLRPATFSRCAADAGTSGSGMIDVRFSRAYFLRPRGVFGIGAGFERCDFATTLRGETEQVFAPHPVI